MAVRVMTKMRSLSKVGVDLDVLKRQTEVDACCDARRGKRRGEGEEGGEGRSSRGDAIRCSTKCDVTWYGIVWYSVV